MGEAVMVVIWVNGRPILWISTLRKMLQSYTYITLQKRWRNSTVFCLLFLSLQSYSVHSATVVKKH